jgi:hypothetical protein
MIRFAAVMAASLLANVADTPPVFDPASGCRAAKAADRMFGRGLEECMRDETDARARLQQTWGEFTAADRTMCARSAAMGYPSYVELLTCLEIARDARTLPKDDELFGVGPRSR